MLVPVEPLRKSPRVAQGTRRSGNAANGGGVSRGLSKVDLGRATPAAAPAVWPASPTLWTGFDGRNIEQQVLLTHWTTQTNV